MFYTLLFRISKLQQSFVYQGAKIWNSIPYNLADLSYSKFKASYKQY